MILDVGITVAKISDEREGSVDILLPRRSEDEILFFTQATDSTSLEPVKTQKSNERERVSVSSAENPAMKFAGRKSRNEFRALMVSPLHYFSLIKLFS